MDLPGLDEPVGLRARAVTDPDAVRAEMAAGRFLAGPLWKAWGSVLAPAGVGRATLSTILRGYGYELWLWVVGERTWAQCLEGLAGRVNRRAASQPKPRPAKARKKPVTPTKAARATRRRTTRPTTAPEAAKRRTTKATTARKATRTGRRRTAAPARKPAKAGKTASSTRATKATKTRKAIRATQVTKARKAAKSPRASKASKTTRARTPSRPARRTSRR